MLREEELTSMHKKSFSVRQTWRPIQTYLTVLHIKSSQQKKKKKNPAGAGSGKDKLFSVLMKVQRGKFAL